MAHRRVKDISYDEDELDEYSDEYEGEEGSEELSAEDKEQMRVGTVSVREALGDGFAAVTDAQIQEALWHYFYDVGKSVTYLKNQHAPQKQQVQQPKKPKQASKFDQAAISAAQKTNNAMTSSAYPQPPPPLVQAPTTAADWFKDVPWYNVPVERLAHIYIEPQRPPLRLLGGSGKPSKLAALAAARKKKEAEAKGSSNEAGAADANKALGALSILDRLGGKSAQAPATHLQKENALPPQTEAETETATATVPLRSYPVRKRKSPSPPPAPERRPTPSEPSIIPQPVVAPTPDLRAGPSIFARAMCGGHGGHTRIVPAAEARCFQENIIPTLFGNTENLADGNPFAGPSPDDIVIQAQAKASAAKKQAQQKDGRSVSVAGVSNGVSSMKIDEPAPAPKVKSKNLDVLAEYGKAGRKNAASFVVIGHVDHGKSTLMGRLLYDLKVVDQRSLDKYQKEATSIGKSSFALAWVMDSTSEERERGVTVDIATNHFETEKTKFTILDAPGHRDFIPNMIAGASQADFAVLVIDAGTNSFEAGLRGQTKEHALLVRSMGVQRIIVAINKMDSIQWAQDRFEEIKQQISAFLTTAGFQARNIAFVPCSGLTGENVVAAPPPASAGWYTSRPDAQTLVQALEAHEPSKAALTQPFRLPISDVFRGGITNPLSVSGKIEAGSCQVGDVLLAMPANETLTIKAIELDDAPADWAVAGQMPTLHLADIDPVHLRIADILCDPRRPLKNIRAFTVKVLAFEHLLPMHVDVHRGRLHVPARVTSLIALLDKTSGEPLGKKKPRVVQPGAVARIRVELDTAVPLEVPARVVLRAAGATVAAGLLEEVFA